MNRLTTTDMVKLTGICSKTIRRYADQGDIPHSRDRNGWRIFNEKSLDAAKEIFGLADEKEYRT